MKNLSFRAKLFTLVGFLIAVSMIIGGISFITLNKVSSSYVVIKDVNFPNTKNLLEEMVLLRSSRIEVLNLALPGTTEDADKKSRARIEENWAKILEYDKAYLSVPFQPGEEPIYNEYKAALNDWKKTQEKAIELYSKSADEHSPERRDKSSPRDRSSISSPTPDS